MKKDPMTIEDEYELRRAQHHVVIDILDITIESALDTDHYDKMKSRKSRLSSGLDPPTAFVDEECKLREGERPRALWPFLATVKKLSPRRSLQRTMKLYVERHAFKAPPSRNMGAELRCLPMS
eukprot:6487556-Amphidinium_carterae.1